MIRLSVNVNKIATLRNSRGGRLPAVIDAVHVCLKAGAHGITVHPRADRRHITPDDVREISTALDGRRPAIEYNIEGDPRQDWLDLVHEVCPDQCTLVPVVPGEVTSQAGWRAGHEGDRLPAVIKELKAHGMRVSLFVDPEDAPIRLAAALGADRVELYTDSEEMPASLCMARIGSAGSGTPAQAIGSALFLKCIGCGKCYVSSKHIQPHSPLVTPSREWGRSGAGETFFHNGFCHLSFPGSRAGAKSASLACRSRHSRVALQPKFISQSLCRPGPERQALVNRFSQERLKWQILTTQGHNYLRKLTKYSPSNRMH